MTQQRTCHKTIAQVGLLMLMTGTATAAAHAQQTSWEAWRAPTSPGARFAPDIVMSGGFVVGADGVLRLYPDGVAVSNEDEPREQPVPRAATVSPAPSVAAVPQAAGSRYVLQKLARVRAAPSMTAATVQVLRPGEELQVLGPAGDQWLRVARDGAAIGFIFKTLVRPARGG